MAASRRRTDAFPLHLADLVGKAPHAEAAQPSARVLWAGRQGLPYVLFRRDPPHFSLRLETSVKTLAPD